MATDLELNSVISQTYEIILDLLLVRITFARNKTIFSVAENLILTPPLRRMSDTLLF